MVISIDKVEYILLRMELAFLQFLRGNSGKRGGISGGEICTFLGADWKDSGCFVLADGALLNMHVNCHCKSGNGIHPPPFIMIRDCLRALILSFLRVIYLL